MILPKTECVHMMLTVNHRPPLTLNIREVKIPYLKNWYNNLHRTVPLGTHGVPNLNQFTWCQVTRPDHCWVGFKYDSSYLPPAPSSSTPPHSQTPLNISLEQQRVRSLILTPHSAFFLPSFSCYSFHYISCVYVFFTKWIVHKKSYAVISVAPIPHC